MTATHETSHHCVQSDRLATAERAIKDLERWQSHQNGTLVRLEDKIDNQKTWVMGAALAGTLAMLGALGQILSQVVAKH
jgi:pyruvate/2-oxoacid:ferredoxin oxidoreductase alpha subunit